MEDSGDVVGVADDIEDAHAAAAFAADGHVDGALASWHHPSEHVESECMNRADALPWIHGGFEPPNPYALRNES